MRIILASIVFVLFISPSWGGDFDKGLEAYDNGDYTTALEEWKPLAEQGLPEAQYYIGRLYFDGDGVEENYKTAKHYFKLAVNGFKILAEQGNSDAQYHLGEIYYYYSRFLQEEDYESVKWFTLAAKQGHPEAQAMLGFMYQIGIGGVNKDLKTAYEWYTLAAKQGQPDAQFELGLYYFDNDREYSQKSFKWFLLAGEQGHAKAQTFLAILYFNGYGVQKDYSYGLMWINLAIANGDAQAYHNREFYGSLMTPSQIEKTRELTSECVKKEYKDC